MGKLSHVQLIAAKGAGDVTSYEILADSLKILTVLKLNLRAHHYDTCLVVK